MLLGREGGRFARGRGLRNDFGNGLRAIPRRAIAFRGAFRIEKNRRRNGTAGAKRGEIFAVRDIEEARARGNEILWSLIVSLLAEPSSARPAVAPYQSIYEIASRSSREADC